MNLASHTYGTGSFPRTGLLLVLLVLCATLGGLFFGSCKSGQVLFSNDGPLGLLNTQAEHKYGNLFAYWVDSYWLGSQRPSALTNYSTLLYMLVDPVTFAKFYAPLALIVLGLGAWLLFRQLGLGAVPCALGAIAAALNSNAFSNACWGLPSRALTFASTFFALAALQSGLKGRLWLKAPLAGFAVALGIMEGFDLGALMSLCVAAYACFSILCQPGAAMRKAFKGIGLVAVVAAFSAWFGAQALSTLIGTQVQGVAGMEQDKQTKARRWAEATQWSLPKVESLRVIIPGLFGYRMDTLEGGNYWGAVGQDAAVPELKKALQNAKAEDRAQVATALANRWRYSGSGEYAGVAVVLVALWSVIQALRGAASTFSLHERRSICFWSVLCGISLVLAFGRWAPFYRLVYALPYFSMIRNPIKFMAPFHLGLLILFGYGLQDLARRYLGAVPVKMPATAFEKRWTWWSCVALGLAFLGWLIYGSAQGSLEHYLQDNGFDGAEALLLARFSAHEVFWFVFFLALSVGWVILTLRRSFQGKRAAVGGLLLGVLLVADLCRANLPWIVYVNYREKYATNGLFDFLRQQPYEHRLTVLPIRAPQMGLLEQLYQVEWLQLQFPYYNIQCLDIPQEPRPTEDKTNYLAAISPHPLRYWELSNTRYLLGLADLVEPLNQQLDPIQRRFRLQMAFALQQEQAGSPILVQTNTSGPYGLIAFAGALPRAKLYARWEVNTNPPAVLQELASPSFDPWQTVIVATNLPAAPSNVASNAPAGTVQFTSYAPKQLVLQAKTESPAVLLLNDRFDPNWKVWVDHQPQPVLRCNYMVRGVFLPQPGQHEIEFRFEPPATTFYVSLAALVVGCVLIGVLMISGKTAFPETDDSASPTTSGPPQKPVPSPKPGAKPKPAASKRPKSP